MKKSLFLLTTMIVLVSTVVGGEPDNDTPSGATVLTAGADYWLSQVTDGDIDWYKVTITGPGLLDWRVLTQSGGPYVIFIAYTTPNSTTPPYQSVSIPTNSSGNIEDIFVPSGSQTYYAVVQEASGQSPGNGYYRIKASFEPISDTVPPSPNPSQWLQEPFALSPTSIQMSCQTSSDSISPPVQYYFDFMEGSGGHDSNWISDNVYTDTGLTPNTSYGYQVKARDSASTPNETTAANKRSCYTWAAVPPVPTVNNPTTTTLDVTPNRGTNSINTELAIYNETYGYYLKADGTSNGSTEVWLRDFEWGVVNAKNLQPNTSYSFKVKAKNHDDIETAFGDPASLSTLSLPPTPQITTKTIDKFNVKTGEPFNITLKGKNLSGSTADFGGLAVQIRQAFTQDDEVNESHLAIGANSGQQVWWKDDQLSVGRAQYIRIERTWNNWAVGTENTLQATITPLKPGTYDIYCKMYLKYGNSYPRDPAGTTPDTDHQNEATYKMGTVTVNTTPSITSIYGIGLVESQNGKVKVDINAGENGNYYVKVFDDDLTPPSWNWQSTSTEARSLTAGADSTFTFDVVPTSSEQKFQFWLYKQSIIPGVFFIVDKKSCSLSSRMISSIQLNDFYYSPGIATDNSAIGMRIPLVLVHGAGNDSKRNTENYWHWWLEWFNQPPQCDIFKVYRYVYNSSNHISANGADLAQFLNSRSELFGRRVLLFAHSMGGLVCRSALNDQNLNNRVDKLVTLATPHLGSPGANPPWIGSCVPVNPLNLLGLYGEYCAFDGSDGAFDLAWYSPDDIPPLAFDIIGAFTLWPYLYDYNLMNNSMQTPFVSTLNQAEEKVIAFGGVNSVQGCTGPADEINETAKDHSNLSKAYLILSQIYQVGLVYFVQNDGLVPLESALFVGSGVENVNLSSTLNKSLDHSSFLDDAEVIQEVGDRLIQLAQSIATVQTPVPQNPQDETFLNTLIPQFTWSEFEPAFPDQSQSGYQLRVRSDSEDDQIIYDTGFIQDTSSHSHTYSPGAYSGVDSISGDTRISESLQWDMHYHWHVRYRDSEGNWSLWSADEIDNHQDFYTVQPTGSLQVTITPQAAVDEYAQWRIDNAGPWYPSEDILSNVTAGQHIVTFTEIPGWIKPADVNIDILPDQINQITRSYTYNPEPILSVDPSNRNVSAASGSTFFDVSNTGTGDMDWSAEIIAGSDWLSIASGETGTNNGSISCSYDANLETTLRTGTIRITALGAGGSPAEVTVSQAGQGIQQYSLSANVVNGHGTVNPSGWYDFGTIVNLIASPDPGYQVKKWVGTNDDNLKSNTNTVTMNSNKIVTVEFESTSTTFSLTTNIQGSGTVLPSNEIYTAGTEVQLIANAAPGWIFDHWEGSLNGSMNPFTITMNDNKSVTAVFRYTGDFNGSGFVELNDLEIFVSHWLNADCAAPYWGEGTDYNHDGMVNFIDFSFFASHWLQDISQPNIPITWVSISDPGFVGQMSKYETTNAQYCAFLNAANASGDITINGRYVYGAQGGVDSDKVYYDMEYTGYDFDGATGGGASRIHLVGETFVVDPGFNNHPIHTISYYGAIAFCNYYGYRLPTAAEWNAVADFNGTYTYGCGTSINTSIANCRGSSHPHGTSPVGSFGSPEGYGYGLCDMAGNVWEWTTTSYANNDYEMRGGSWYDDSSRCAISYKTGGYPIGTNALIGFRVVKDLEITWVSINDPGFVGQMSKYETTNAQYCKFLKAAKACGLITVHTDNYVYAVSDTSYSQPYYNLAGPGYTYDNAVDGGKARIHYDGSLFTVDPDFENHPVTYVSWYGATAFCNYYGYRLPTEWEWQAVADFNGTYTYGCGSNIDNTIANYYGSIHPYGTTVVGAFDTYGYGLADITGNIWEWTSSCYDSDCGSGYRVLRGGCWSDDYTVSIRNGGAPSGMGWGSGFRVVKNLEIAWVTITDPGVSDHEAFNGQMSKHEITNAQYCNFLNEAISSGDITANSSTVWGANGSNNGEDYAGQTYYNLAGPGFTGLGSTDGGAARINFDGSVFTVDSGFENHPVTQVTWYGATAFCNYYGYRLPTEWEWQAVADFNDGRTYACGAPIDITKANYEDTPHPNGTTLVGVFGEYGYTMCDMAGNAWEWTSSPSGSEFVYRGYCWCTPGSICTVTGRGSAVRSFSDQSLGFRVCR